MKTAFLLFFILLVASVWDVNAGLPPTTLSGQSQTVKPTTFNFKTPNYQSTQISGITSLIETGNKNILDNPSFEHSTYDTSWTASGTGTKSAESTVVIDGLKAFKSVTSSQTIDLSQSSTLYQAQFADGVQCLASIRLKTSHIGAISICAIQAGTVSTTNCVTANADSKWGLYKIPFICGATSNGISIVGASGTGTTYIDDAFVGAQDLIQDADQSRIAGESYFAGTASCLWSRTSTTVGAFTATAACPGPTVNSSTMGTWASTDADLPRQTITNLPAGKYKATFIQAVSASGTVGTSLAINDGTTTCEGQGADAQASTSVTGITSCVFNYVSSGDRTFELYGATTLGTLNIQNAQITPRRSVKFLLEYFGSTSTYSSQCGANCVDTFSAKVSAAGVVSDENVDFINGNCTVSGTSIYTCPLLTSLGLTVKMNCVVALDNAGTNVLGAFVDTSNYSTTQIVHITTNSSTGGPNARPVTISCSKTGADFKASRTIVGSFKDIPTTLGTSGSDIQSVYFGASSDCTTNCTTGTCVICNKVGGKITSVTWVGAGSYNLNSIDGKKYNCSGTAYSGVGYPLIHDMNSSTTSFARVTAGTAMNTALNSVTCIGKP